MRIILSNLVFHKKVRAFDFADIMIISGDPDQQTVGVNALRSRFGKVSDHNTVMVSARRFYQKSAQ